MAESGLTEAERAGHAGPLGRFLRALHEIDPGAVITGGELLPIDPVRRADMPYRVDFLSRRLASLAGLDLWHPPPGLGAELRTALRLPDPAQLCICHGDLHLRHVLVGDGNEPSAVIDWIDVCRADPAIDLPLYWGHLPPDARPAFLEAYGGASDDQLLRARVLAVFLWATIAEFAHEGRMPALLEEALGGLDRATADLR
jgi:aminoglycoside phosphotransferase (APT) family kinase protein